MGKARRVNYMPGWAGESRLSRSRARHPDCSLFTGEETVMVAKVRQNSDIAEPGAALAKLRQAAAACTACDLYKRATHPSAILRARDSTDRQAMMRQFVADFRRAARVAGKTVRPV
jgi:hypothetical protein